MNKKSQTNQIFVYILSTIVVLFVGFLVIKFVIGFLQANEDRTIANFFTDLKKDYKEVYTNYGSEKVASYRVTGEVKYLCISEEDSCDSANLKGITENQKTQFISMVTDTKSNIALFSDTFILTQTQLDEFRVKDGCMCVKAIDKKINLVFENRRNVVWVLAE